MTIRHAWRLAGAALVSLALVACGGNNDDDAGDLISATRYDAPAPIAADGKLLTHWITGLDGKLTKATALLFVPRGTAPAAGWPVVAWVHATTTVGSGRPAATDCAPSLSPDLDGGLTADGFTSYYVDTIAALVSEGFAVLAPDLEGMGAVAQADGTPYPYFNLSSSGHSVAGALIAAHKAVKSLSRNWASMGHSEGGHAVMALETTTAEARAYSYKGAVAFAPYNSIEASVNLLGNLSTADPANEVSYRTVQELFVAMMSTALVNQKPSFVPSAVMGADLLATMPSVNGQCIFKALGSVGAAVATKTPAAFAGFNASWATEPAMSAFLRANDLAVAPDFRVRKPTLVLQGGADPFVFASLQTEFVDRLTAAGMPVTYGQYPTADHSTIMTQGRAEMLAFLKTLLP